MKRFGTSLLATTAYAVSDLFHSEGQKIEFKSIDAQEKIRQKDDDKETNFTLTGNYGTFKTLGTNNAYIMMTVGDGQIEDETTVLTWVEIMQNDGKEEGFWCSTIYNKDKK